MCLSQNKSPLFCSFFPELSVGRLALRRLSRKLRWARRQNARRSCESAFCETFVKIAIRCTGCARMLLSGYHGCRVLCRCGDSHACGGSQGSVPPECETFVISAPRLPRGYRLSRAPKVVNVSQNWRRTGSSGASELHKTSRLCARPASCRASLLSPLKK